MEGSKNYNPKEIFEKMYAQDAFSQWLGIECISSGENYCKLSMKVKADMLNGFDIVHGGILFALADSALAFAANSRGFIELTVEAGIHFHEPSKLGQTLFAEAKSIAKSKKHQIFEVLICDESGQLKGSFKGTAYQSSRRH